jgi:hypothetical protein
VSWFTHGKPRVNQREKMLELDRLFIAINDLATRCPHEVVITMQEQSVSSSYSFMYFILFLNYFW